MVIQKADKGNSLVIVEKDVYLTHTETIISDHNKFEKVSIKRGILNFSINHEKNIKYGLCKVHKAITDICPPFKPILSAIGTPNYKLATFLVLKLPSITFN